MFLCKKINHMKKNLILSILFIALGFGIVKAQELPDRRETMKAIVKVNDYFMKNGRMPYLLLS